MKIEECKKCDKICKTTNQRLKNQKNKLYKTTNQRLKNQKNKGQKEKLKTPFDKN